MSNICTYVTILQDRNSFVPANNCFKRISGNTGTIRRGVNHVWLVKKAQQGDADAFVTLMEQHKQALYKVAKSYLSCEADIADVMSETTLSAYEHISELKTAAYFKTWITRILINHCKNELNKQKRCVIVEEIPKQIIYEDSTADKDFMDLIRELPEDYRLIFVLYYGEGFRTREIAEILEISENTVKSRLKRGRIKLEHVLQA